MLNVNITLDLKFLHTFCVITEIKNNNNAGLAIWILLDWKWNEERTVHIVVIILYSIHSSVPANV